MESRDIAVVIAVLSKILTFINYSIDFFFKFGNISKFLAVISLQGEQMPMLMMAKSGTELLEVVVETMNGS